MTQREWSTRARPCLLQVALSVALGVTACGSSNHDSGLSDAGRTKDSGLSDAARPDALGPEAESGTSATLSIAPMSATVAPSETQTFTCTVKGLANAGCDWAVEEASGGSITSAGLYTAPAASGAYHVVATSTALPTLSTKASVIVPAAGDCSSLAAVGTWEDITPADFTTPANMQSIGLVVNPQQPNIVYATAGNITNGNGCPMGMTCPSVGKGVYKSTDCGKTFTALSLGPDDAFKSGDLWAIRIDAVNPNNLYTMNGYGSPPTLFKSTDSGATWANLFTSSQFTTPASSGGLFQYGGFVRSFDISAADPTHLVVAFHENCMGSLAAASSNAMNGEVMCLAESQDGGATWNIYEGPVAPTSADGGAPTILGTNELLYTSPNTGTGYFTNDPERKVSSWKEVLPYTETGPFYALNQSGGYFAADGSFYMGGQSGIFFTSPGAMFGESWTMIPGSPETVIMGGDGRQAASGGTLFSSGNNPASYVYSAPLMGTTTFTPMKTPTGLMQGVETFAYDPTHHILYSAAWSSGLWRVVTY